MSIFYLFVQSYFNVTKKGIKKCNTINILKVIVKNVHADDDIAVFLYFYIYAAWIRLLPLNDTCLGNNCDKKKPKNENLSYHRSQRPLLLLFHQNISNKIYQ